jgi:glycosyltransferase involved in cell wall biosynthesis/GT2 family glycosyltransferase
MWLPGRARLNKLVKKDEGGLRFGLDLMPAAGGSRAISGWAFHTSLPVVLELRLNGESLFVTCCNHVRPDVGSIHKSSPYSLTSGFFIEFPEGVFEDFHNDLLQLMVVSEGGAEEIWRWGVDREPREANGERAGGQISPREVLSSHFSSYNLYAPKDLLSLFRKGSESYKIDVLLESDGLDEKFESCLGRVLSLGSGTRKSYSLRSLAVVIPSDSLKAEYEKAIANFAFHRSLKLKVVVGDEIGAWSDVLPQSDADLSEIVFHIKDSFDFEYTNFDTLVSHFASYPGMQALMPAVSGVGTGLESPKSGLENHYAAGHEGYRATFSSGPNWLLNRKVLSQIEKSTPFFDSYKDQSYFKSRFAEIPNSLAFPFHVDLGQFATTSKPIELSIPDDEKVRMNEVLSENFPFCLNGESSQRVVFVVLPGSWDETTSSIGWQGQVLELASRLKSEGGEVVFLSRNTSRDSKFLPGWIVADIKEVTPEIVAKRNGWVIATSYDTIADACVLRLVTGFEICWFVQSADDLRFAESYCEERPRAEWARRGDFVRLFNSQAIRSHFDDALELSAESVWLDVGLDEKVFPGKPCDRTPQSILCLLGGRELSAKAQVDLKTVFEEVRKQIPTVKITLAGFVSSKVDNSLSELCDQAYPPLTTSELVSEYCSHEVVLDYFNFYSTNTVPLEARACGAVPVVSIESLANDFVEDGKDGFVFEQSDVGHLQRLLVDILSKEKLYDLKLASSKQPKSEKQVFCSLDDSLLSLKQRVESERTPKKGLTVIVPVFNALDAVASCLESLFSNISVIDQIVVVSDNSDFWTTQWLSELAQREPSLTLVEHSTSRGFIQACQTGLRCAKADNDILIVHSDSIACKETISGLVAAAYSRPSVAIASPLFAGSADSPVVVNYGDSLQDAATKISQNHKASYPTVITPEGSFMYVRRWAIDRFGLFDGAYGKGRCEDLDVCMRMFLNGADTVLADDTLVYHQGAVSSKIEGAAQEFKVNETIFNARWKYHYELASEYSSPAQVVKKVRDSYAAFCPLIEKPRDPFDLKEVDQRYDISIALKEKVSVLGDAQVVFILPSVVQGGGTLSVLQHANSLIRRGIKARVISLSESHSDFSNLAPIIPVSVEQLYALDWSNQKVIATFWLTAHLVKNLVRRFPKLDGYYYIQDYEPWFYSTPTEFIEVGQAERTYELGLKCVAKTQFLCDTVKEKHGVDVTCITAGIDRKVFYPGRQDLHEGRPRLVALYRPHTPRRGASELLQVLGELRKRIPELEPHLFGDAVPLPEELADWVTLHGRLTQKEVAALYRRSDIVVDMSYWHGFGRMGIEGMSCGVVPVLSRSGGIDQYAEDKKNSLLFTVEDWETCVEHIVSLAVDTEVRHKMRREGIDRCVAFDEEIAADDWLKVLGFAPSSCSPIRGELSQTAPVKLLKSIGE